MVPVSIKRKGPPNLISSQHCPHRVSGCIGGQEAREPSSKNTGPESEPSAQSGSGKGWPCAQLTEPFPPRLGQVSCPEGTEHAPRQRGAPLDWGRGQPQAFPPTSATLQLRGLPGGRARGVRDQRLGLRWPFLEEGAEATLSNFGASLPLCPRCAPGVGSRESYTRCCLSGSSNLWVTVVAFAEKRGSPEPGILQEPSRLTSSLVCPLSLPDNLTTVVPWTPPS